MTALLDDLARARSISLRGTPVTDAILVHLDRIPLEHLDLVDTVVSAEALAAFRVDHPDINLFPQPKPLQAEDYLGLRIIGPGTPRPGL